MSSIRDRFMRHVDQAGAGGCWLWTGAKRPLGYGAMMVGSRRDGTKRADQAHRISYELHKGPIPTGLHVCHACDIPSCVNPEHLWLGSHADNMADMARKGRSPHGEKQGCSKLTAADVAEIINNSSVMSQRELAAKFDVVPSNISLILSGKRWKRLQAAGGDGAVL